MNNPSLQIWRRARINGQIITSTHAKDTKSIDYFVKCENSRMGKIVYFLKINSIWQMLLHIYEENFQNFHWLEVNQTDSFEVYPTSQIKEKLLYFKVGSTEYVTKEPYSYSRASW